MLPKELIVIESDTDGRYQDNEDCTLARALKRSGITMNWDDGYVVGGWGNVMFGTPFKLAGEYKWDNGDTFVESTKKRIGKLVLCSN